MRPGAAVRLTETAGGAAVPTYVHFDHLGSAVAASGASGGILWRERYSPFGKATRTQGSAPANDNNAGFTGHLEDDTSGLVYMQARYYDPLVPRFLSTDPIGYEDQLNLYAYVGNDPVNRIDPTGEIALYLNVQAVFQVGGFGGRISFSAGVDTKKRTAFAAYSKGGSGQDIAAKSDEANGIQFGFGAGAGVASSSDFVVAPAYTTDADIIVGSVSVSSNDPIVDADANVKLGEPTLDFSKDGSASSGRDTTIRQIEIGVGLGVGTSTIKTQGAKFEGPLPFVPRPETEPCVTTGNC